MELVSTLKTLFFFYFYQTFSVETQSDYYNYGYLSALNSVVSLNEKKDYFNDWSDDFKSQTCTY